MWNMTCVTCVQVRLHKQGAGLGASQGVPAEGHRDTKKRKRGGERSRKKCVMLLSVSVIACAS